MTVASKTAELTKAINDTVKELDITEASLDAKVTSATTNATTAATHQTTAEGYRDTTATHAATIASHLSTVNSGVTFDEIAAVATSKTETAVDVFVYDTSLDSDGGAWRKRTQHTSWYNETLNTATRGSRKEFPSVAVIVAESDTVTIYDGDDPSLPMWMVFNDGNWTIIPTNYFASGSHTSLAALNGVLCAGGTGSALKRVSFIDDQADMIGNSLFKYKGNLVDRNRTDLDFIQSGANPHIVGTIVNDVAMTVLPDAPIDPSTGLPVPTIAVATDGGLSVITDSGAVYDATPNSHAWWSVAFRPEDNAIVGTRFANGRAYIITIYNTPFTADRTDYDEQYNWIGDGQPEDGNYVGSVPEAPNIVRVSNNGKSVRTDKHGFFLFGPNPTTPSDYMRSQVTSTFNTGWMNGDIKGAFLSDTDDTDVSSALFNSNSSFDTDVTGVTPFSGASISHDTGGDGGRLKVTSDGTRYCGVFINYSTAIESGKTYLFQIDYTVGTYSGNVNLSANGQNTSPAPNFSTSGTYSAYLTSTYSGTAARQMRIRFNDAHTAGEYFFVDNVIIKEVETDRSVNANHLTPFGTITRSPVATGSELVGYSDFTYSDYIEQPYNSDLDFGTNDFCYMGWLSDFDNWRTVVWRGITDVATSFVIDPAGTGGTARINLGGTPYTTDCTHWTNEWRHMVVLRASGVVKVYVNAVLQSSFSASSSNLTVANATLRFGSQASTASGYGIYSQGQLALWRISATAPTADQIAKIYKDERKLFQENAACTLYGSSNAVTALSHDSKTNLLHVGTSDGRSTFDGLRRVSNTTTAVDTAISASSGLIVEE